jgi:NAD(P)-dependent dehydrogenase (short-subunit alcohol dehydrogenase family)
MNSLKLFDLSGKRALVTGGARGIGNIIAYSLAEAGADVAIASRNEEDCARVAHEIARATGRITYSAKLDVAEKKSVEDTVKRLSE